jgi:hypothetical protein
MAEAADRPGVLAVCLLSLITPSDEPDEAQQFVGAFYLADTIHKIRNALK